MCYWWRAVHSVQNPGPGERRAVATVGRHLLAEYCGCDRTILNDRGRIARLLRRAAAAAGANVVAEVYRPFAPQGVSGVVVIEESHLSIHTWPETGYAAVDFYTCGECLPDAAHAVLLGGLRAERAELMVVERGRQQQRGALVVCEHRHEDNAAIRVPVAHEP